MWQIEPIEKDTGHLVVVMLPGVDQDHLMALSEHATDRCGLDELRPRPDDRHDSQRRPRWPGECLCADCRSRTQQAPLPEITARGVASRILISVQTEELRA